MGLLMCTCTSWLRKARINAICQAGKASRDSLCLGNVIACFTIVRLSMHGVVACLFLLHSHARSWKPHSWRTTILHLAGPAAP